MTSPEAQALFEEIRPLIDSMLQEAVERARATAQVTTWMPGTVEQVSGSTVDVVIDGPPDEDAAVSQGVAIGPPPSVGDRVMTVHVPPSVLFVLGKVYP